MKLIVRKHLDGSAADPLGLRGVVLGEDDTREASLADVKPAVGFHIETVASHRVVSVLR